MREIFAGVDVGGTRIKIGLADASGQLISMKVVETKDCRDATSFLGRICQEISELANSASGRVVSVGLGCPGRVDFRAGKVIWLKCKLEFLEGVPITTLLGEQLKCPVVCDNDANTILAGEMRFGAGRGHREVAAITVGTGIGGALSLDGKLVRGQNWATGHFGFMSQNPEGPWHVCGNTGIVEEYASQSGVQRQVRRALWEGEVSHLTNSAARGAEPDFRELFDAADGGDPLAGRLTERLVAELGVLVANLIYAFDPAIVLIGGGIVNCRSAIVEAVRHEAEWRLDYLPQGATAILPMELGDAGGILGGVALAADALAKLKEGSNARGEQG